MKRKTIISIAVTAFVALSVLEVFSGASVAYARNNVDPVKAREYQSGAPNNPNGGQTENASSDVPLVPSSLPAAYAPESVAHTHDFQPVTVQEASETQDEVRQLKCVCGVVSKTFIVPGSSLRAFIERVVKDITDAPKDAVVTVDTKIWTCYNKEVMDALSRRTDVTLVTNYRYNHVDYTVTIPAGYDVAGLLDENGYCGFRYLDQIFGE